MADRYWVGGSGNWSSTNTANWSTTSGGAGGASVPTINDRVFFDAGSDSGGSFVVTLQNSPRVCSAFSASSLDFNMTLAGSGVNLTIGSGDLLFPATNFTRTYTGTTTFGDPLSSGGIFTITTNGVAFGGNVTIDSGATSITLGSDFSCGTSTLTLTKGTFDTGGYNITCGTFNLSNSNTRSLTLNSSTITCSSNWTLSTTTGLTFNAGTSTINLSATNSTFSGGGLTYYNVAFTSSTATTDSKSISGVNTFNNLTFNSLTASGLNNISFSANQTINGTFTVSTASVIRRQFIRSSTLGTQRTLTCAAVSLAEVDFRDIVIAGVAAPATGTRIGNCGNNSGITFTAAANKYWVGASSANWNSNSWSLSSGGAAATNNFPLPQDTAIIDNSILPAGQTVTLNAAYNYPAIDTSARTNAMTLSFSQDSTIVGGLLVGSGVTVSGTSFFDFTNDSVQQISGNLLRFEINGFSTGGVQLSGATTATSQVNLANGTLDLNGYTLTANFFQVLSGTKDITFNGGTIAVTGSGGVSWSNSNPTNFTTTAGSGTGTISMTSASAKTFTGGGSTYNCTLNQGGAGTLTIAGGNTFGDITNTHAGSSTISLGATQTVSNFTLSGTSGNVITFNSSSAGVRRDISKASGTVDVIYLNIVDSNATGGATWNAFTANGNVDGGNNLGWNFVPPTSGSNMFMMFD